MRVILALGQSGISNFALVGKKMKKKCPLNQSAFSNFALYVIKVHIVIQYITPYSQTV